MIHIFCVMCPECEQRFGVCSENWNILCTAEIAHHREKFWM